MRCLSCKGKANEKLNFDMRFKIALDSAKGVLYIHTEANPPEFHQDIETTNIILDSKLTAKVTNFRLSHLRLAGTHQDGIEPPISHWMVPDCIISEFCSLEGSNLGPAAENLCNDLMLMSS